MISVRVDPSAALARLTVAEERQVPFAMSRTLNRLANEAQKSMQEGLKARFKLRRETWNLRGIKINKQDRATKTTWRVVIQVSPQTSYLDKFEKGGEKRPVGGHDYLWEPNAKVFKNQILSQGDPLRPKNLHLHRDPHGRVIGDSRTFLAKTGNPEVPFVVVQRIDRGLSKGSKRRVSKLDLDNFQGGFGPRRKSEKVSLSRGAGTRTLYKLRKRIPVKAQLQFVPTITRTVQSRFRGVFGEELAAAMRTAR